MPRAYTLRNVVPLPHQRMEGPHVCAFTYTLEECIATVREAVGRGHRWEWYEVTTPGLRWWWEPNGTHPIMREGRVDTPSVS